MICKRMRAAADVGAGGEISFVNQTPSRVRLRERVGFRSTVSLLKARLDVAMLIRPQRREMEARSCGGRSHCSLGGLLQLSAFH